MPKKGKPINSNIRCPSCGRGYPTVCRNGFYKRDKYKIPQYYCKKCKKGFSGSIIKIKVLKPPEEVEIGYKVKVQVEIITKRNFPIEKVEFAVIKDKRTVLESMLNKQSGDLYLGMWDVTAAEEGKYKLVITAEDSGGYGSIKTKVVQVKQHYDTLIIRIATEFGLDPYLIKAMIFSESSFKPDVVSEAGAIGLMQLMPKTASSYGVDDLYDPEQNIRGGVKYFKNLLAGFKGDVKLALAAYNAGPDRIKKRVKSGKPWPRETRQYVLKVLRYWDEFSKRTREYYVQ